MGFHGASGLDDRIRDYEARYPNIHLHPSVPPEEVPDYTRSADVGLYIIEDISLSYRLSVGNKVYEYLLSGVPELASDYPDAARLLWEYGCGWTLEPEPVTLERKIRDLGRAEVEAKRRSAERCQRSFGWQLEEARMLDVYRRLLGRVAA